MFNFGSLFGGNVPNLGDVSAMPGMDMGQLGSAGPIANMTANYSMPQQPDYGGLMAAMGMMGGQQPIQVPQVAQGPQIQPGGGQFTPFYQFRPQEQQPTAQRLAGLLSGVGYGAL